MRIQIQFWTAQFRAMGFMSKKDYTRECYDPVKVLKKHESFMRKIKSFSSRECWEWIGATDGCHGYGRFNGIDNKTYSAHRYSFMEFCGDIPKGMVVMHT